MAVIQCGLYIKMSPQISRAYSEALKIMNPQQLGPSILLPVQMTDPIRHSQFDIDMDKFLAILFLKSPETLGLLCEIKGAIFSTPISCYPPGNRTGPLHLGDRGEN